MSGHSKWATTKRQKEVVDAKRSGLFTKLSKNLSIAAREGADPKSNFKLRIAIDKAKDASMPKENIERAISRGAGTGEGQQLERVVYEGFGPDGIAVIVEAITDNKNRAVQEVKHAFSRHGGNLGSAHAVSWMFDIRGVIELTQSSISDEQELALIDMGLIDIRTHDTGCVLITELSKLQTVQEAAEKLGLTVQEAASGYVPKELLKPKNESSLIALLDALDELDDVDNIYTNADI